MKSKIILFALIITIQNISSQEKKKYDGHYKYGSAKYEYFENKEYERIFDGYFKYVSDDKEFSINGVFKNNMRDGEWTFTNNLLSYYQKLYLTKGNYLNGKKNGIWSYAIKSKDLKNQDLKILKYSNDTLIDVKLDLKHLKGEIDNRGNFIGEWMYYSLSDDKEIFAEFKNNIVVKYLSRTRSTGKLITKYIPNISIIDINSLNKNPFPQKKYQDRFDNDVNKIIDKNTKRKNFNMPYFKDDFNANIKNVIFDAGENEMEEKISEEEYYLTDLAEDIQYFFNKVNDDFYKIYGKSHENETQINIENLNEKFILKEPELIFKTNKDIIELQTNSEVDSKNAEIENNKSKGIIYNITEVDTKPEFPGGIKEFYKFIFSKYRTEFVGIKGEVIVEFVIEQDGSVSNIKAIKDLDYGTGEESIRVMKMCPKWIPAIKTGENVRVLYSFPIKINTNENEYGY